MPDAFLDYLKDTELGRGRLTGTTLPELEKPEFAFGKPLMKPAPVKEERPEDPFISHLRGLETTTPLPPPPERGLVGDIFSSLARGVAVGIPQMGGQAITGLGALTGIEPLKETGRAITGFAEELPEKFPSLAPSEEATRGGFRQFITGMGESIPSILAAAKVGAGIGTLTAPLTGFIGPTVGAILGGMIGVFGTFGLAGKGRAYEEALTQGLPEDQAQSYSNKIGAIEGGVWSLLAPVEAATGGIAGRFIQKPAIDTIRKLLTPRLTKSLAGMAINVPAVTAAGVTSAALQAGAAQEAGVEAPTPEEAAYDAIAPSIGISILFGLASRGMAWKDRQAIFTSLRNESVDPVLRQRAADLVTGRLNNINPEIAEMWSREAGYRIQGRKTIPIDEDYMAWIQKGMGERIPAIWGTPGGGLPAPYGGEPLGPGMVIPRETRALEWKKPPGVQFGEEFIMAEPWVVKTREKTYELPGREAAILLPGPERAIPQLPFYPPPGETIGEGFVAKGGLVPGKFGGMMFGEQKPKIYAKIAEDAYKEVIRIGEDGRPILGDTVYKRSQIVPKEAEVKIGKGRIAPEVGVTSAGALPTERRPSTPPSGAKISPVRPKEVKEKGVTPPGEEIPPIPPSEPLPSGQMDAIRQKGHEMGGLGITMIQRIAAIEGEPINAKKAKEVLDYLVATGEIEPQVGAGTAMFAYTMTGKLPPPPPEKPKIPLPEGITKYKKTHGYMKTDAGWEVYGPEGKIGTAKSRDAAREMIDGVFAGKPVPAKLELPQDILSIPEGITVKVKAVREKTGKVVEIEQGAREALKDVRDRLKNLKDFWECVRG